MIEIFFNNNERILISKDIYNIDFKFTDLETDFKKIVKIVFPNGTIKARNISNLTELTEIIFNNGLLEIECFHSNPKLESVNFPDSLRNLFYFEGNFNNLYLPKNIQKVFLGYCECCECKLKNLTGNVLWLDCDPLMLIYQPGEKKHKGKFIENYYGNDFDNITPCGVFNTVRIPENSVKCCNGAFSTNYYGPYAANGQFGYSSSNYVKSVDKTFFSKYIYDENQYIRGVEDRYKQILLSKDEYDKLFKECEFKPSIDKFTSFNYDSEKYESLNNEINIKLQQINDLNLQITELENTIQKLKQDKKDLENSVLNN